MNRCKICTLHL